MVVLVFVGDFKRERYENDSLCKKRFFLLGHECFLGFEVSLLERFFLCPTKNPIKVL